MIEMILKQLGLNPETVKKQIADSSSMLKDFAGALQTIQLQQLEIIKGINILLEEKGHAKIAVTPICQNTIQPN